MVLRRAAARLDGRGPAVDGSKLQLASPGSCRQARLALAGRPDLLEEGGGRGCALDTLGGARDSVL